MRIEHKVQQPDSRMESYGTPTGFAGKQRSQLRIALALLLVALVAVLVRDREFWFGGDGTPESTATVSQSAPAAAPAKSSTEAQTAADLTAKNNAVPKTSSEPAVTEPAHKIAAKSASPAAATKRVALAPLHVQVVANEKQRTVHLHSDSGSDVAQAEVPSQAKRVSTVSATVATLPTNAAEREPLVSSAVPELRQAVATTYPLLGPRMSVQGSVVLQAVIGSDGIIESLRVVSGPSILTVAAQQAVRQWHFKPYLENGQPVETKATITVNFSIRVGDNPEKAS